MKKLILFAVVLVGAYFGYQHFFGTVSAKIEPLYDPPYIVVYGKTSCGWTQKCLKELKAEGIDVIFENIDKPEVQAEIFGRIDEAGLDRNRISIPIIDVNANILIGYEHDKILKFYNQ